MKAKPWFGTWFGKEYLDLYPHRNVEEAKDAIRLLVDAVRPEPGARVLDLACGAGRHVVELEAAGLHAVGLDLSAELLVEAHRADPKLVLVRADMRSLPLASGSFDLVTSFFTSFGYFEDLGDDGRVLAEVHRVLRPGGFFLLDFLNAELVSRDLKPYDVREKDGSRVHQERSLVDEGRVVQKRITIEGEDGARRTFTERVRLYRPEELHAMLAMARLEPLKSYGNYDGAPFESRTPRFIVIGRAL